jgi:hypothetical protein
MGEDEIYLVYYARKIRVARRSQCLFFTKSREGQGKGKKKKREDPSFSEDDSPSYLSEEEF